jgi:hypothetical protein
MRPVFPVVLGLALAGLASATVHTPDPAEVPADLLTAPDGLLEAVHHTYFPGDHDPSTPSGSLRWRVWTRHFPEVAGWAAAHHATAEWAHHHPDRTRWALENPGDTTFVVNHPDVLEWKAAHPLEAARAREARATHPQRTVWDELTGRTEGHVSDAAMAAATAPEATPDVVLPAPAEKGAVAPVPATTTAKTRSVSSTASARFQVQRPRFEVRKPKSSNVIAQREPAAPAPVAAPSRRTVVVHETVVVPTYESPPVVLHTSPRLRYRHRYRRRPRIVFYKGWGRHHGWRHGRRHRRHRRYRPWW